jgi:hypothetical protein
LIFSYNLNIQNYYFVIECLNEKEVIVIFPNDGPLRLHFCVRTNAFVFDCLRGFFIVEEKTGVEHFSSLTCPSKNQAQSTVVMF